MFTFFWCFNDYLFLLQQGFSDKKVLEPFMFSGANLTVTALNNFKTGHNDVRKFYLFLSLTLSLSLSLSL